MQQKHGGEGSVGVGVSVVYRKRTVCTGVKLTFIYVAIACGVGVGQPRTRARRSEVIGTVGSADACLVTAVAQQRAVTRCRMSVLLKYIYIVQFQRRPALTLHFVTVNSVAVNSVAAIF